MSRSVYVLDRPVPKWSVPLSWARFVEGAAGATDSGDGATPPAGDPGQQQQGESGAGAGDGQTPPAKTPEAPKPGPKPGPKPDAKSATDDGKPEGDADKGNEQLGEAGVRALVAEREERRKAEARAAKAELALSIRDLAAAHGITSADDIAVLSTIPDEAARKTLAARLAPGKGAASGPSARSLAGTGSPSGGSSGGSVQAGRERYAAQHRKTTTERA